MISLYRKKKSVFDLTTTASSKMEAAAVGSCGKASKEIRRYRGLQSGISEETWPFRKVFRLEKRHPSIENRKQANTLYDFAVETRKSKTANFLDILNYLNQVFNDLLLYTVHSLN